MRRVASATAIVLLIALTSSCGQQARRQPTAVVLHAATQLGGVQVVATTGHAIQKHGVAGSARLVRSFVAGSGSLTLVWQAQRLGPGAYLKVLDGSTAGLPLGRLPNYLPEIDTSQGYPWSSCSTDTGPPGSGPAYIKVASHRCRWRVWAITGGRAILRYTNPYYGFSLLTDSVDSYPEPTPMTRRLDPFGRVVSGVLLGIYPGSNENLESSAGSEASGPPGVAGSFTWLGVCAARLPSEASRADLESVAAGLPLTTPKGSRPEPTSTTEVTLGTARGLHLHYRWTRVVHYTSGESSTSHTSRVSLTADVYILVKGRDIYLVQEMCADSLCRQLGPAMQAMVRSFRAG
jgi:hypothetical protein